VDISYKTKEISWEQWFSVGIIGIDFFCGIGGTTKGFQNAGIDIKRGIDVDPTCQETYDKNCCPSKFILKNINDLEARDVLADITLKQDDLVLFAACAPCQPFSRHNRFSENDNRANLILTFAELVKDLVPDIIFIENVPGMLKGAKREIFEEFVRILESDDLDYKCNWNLVDAKDYGVPQKRDRLILLASRLGEISFPLKTHGNNLEPYVTVKDAISKYPPIGAGETDVNIPNHITRNLSKLNLKRMIHTPKNGGSRKDWPKDLWLKCHLDKNSGHQDVYGRMHWNKPAPTLTCKCSSLSNGRFGHPEQNRAISLREAATLQTFPEDFIFYGNKTHIARHIGNAVPPLIAEIFGRSIVSHYNFFMRDKLTQRFDRELQCNLR
jgi:DNA (cytosine-5)-methyltransferase 1